MIPMFDLPLPRFVRRWLAIGSPLERAMKERYVRDWQDAFGDDWSAIKMAGKSDRERLAQLDDDLLEYVGVAQLGFAVAHSTTDVG